MQIKVKRFIIGAVNILIGFALGVTMAPFILRPPHHMGPKHHFEKGFQMLTRELELTLKQQEPIRRILENTRSQFRDLHESVVPRLEQIELAALSEMKKHLSEEQQQKLDEFHGKRVRSGKHGRKRAPPFFAPPPPPPPQ